MDSQRLRNITTRKLHTDFSCVYEDLSQLIGEPGLMTHMLPTVMRAVEPWLREHVTDPRFWDNKYDPTHTGDFPIPQPTPEDQEAMLARFTSQPNPLAATDTIVVEV